MAVHRRRSCAGAAARRPGRLALALGAASLAGALAAGCTAHNTASGSKKPTAPAVVTSSKASGAATTTTTTPKAAIVPECGSTRDPFDATNTPAPAGSPAHC